MPRFLGENAVFYADFLPIRSFEGHALPPFHRGSQLEFFVPQISKISLFYTRSRAPARECASRTLPLPARAD
jgi:hypothetical protein